MLLSATVLVFGALQYAAAAPTPAFDINVGVGSTSDAKTTAVSQDDITNNLVRPALFSRAAYCSAGAVENWQCGDSCDALPNVKVLTAGGDDGLIPGFFIAHDVDKNTIVVAHQGTDPKNFLSDLNDLKFSQVDANTTVLPSAGSALKYSWGHHITHPRDLYRRREDARRVR